MLDAKKIVAGIVIILGVVISALILWDAREKAPIDINESYFTVPAGWYLHRTHPSAVMLTEEQKLQDIGATETFAYGEQIGISVMKIDKSPKEWIAHWVPDNDPIFLTKEWGVLNGYPTFITEHISPAADVLDIYLFKDGHAYVFSAYPSKLYDKASKSMVRNMEVITLTEQIMREYAARL